MTLFEYELFGLEDYTAHKRLLIYLDFMIYLEGTQNKVFYGTNIDF